MLKHYHKLPLSHIEHDTKSHFNHPLPKHPKTDFFNNLMSYNSQVLREDISHFCENFEKFSENSNFRSKYTWLEIWARDQNRSLSISARLAFFRNNPMYNSALFKFQEIFEGKIKFSKISNFDRKILFLDFNFLNSSKIYGFFILQVSSRFIAFANLTKRNYVTLRKS